MLLITAQFAKADIALHLCQMHKLSYEIIEDNGDFVAVNKVSGLLTLPDRHQSEIVSLRSLLQSRYNEIYVVHRLDKDTSGLMLFAKNEQTHKYLSGLFENRQIEKEYLAIVLGVPPQTSGDIREPIAEHPVKKGTMIISHKGKEAHTSYRLLENLGRYSLVSFTLHTGRTHQIRVHSSFMGNPVACDPVYGDGKPVFVSAFRRKFQLSKNELEERPILSRLALHAHRLVFKMENGSGIELSAPLHKDMRALISQLEKSMGK